MNMSHYANRGSERNRIFEDLEWEIEEREAARRSAGRPAGRGSVNLTSEIEKYLSELY